MVDLNSVFRFQRLSRSRFLVEHPLKGGQRVFLPFLAAVMLIRWTVNTSMAIGWKDNAPLLASGFAFWGPLLTLTALLILPVLACLALSEGALGGPRAIAAPLGRLQRLLLSALWYFRQASLWIPASASLLIIGVAAYIIPSMGPQALFLWASCLISGFALFHAGRRFLGQRTFPQSLLNTSFVLFVLANPDFLVIREESVFLLFKLKISLSGFQTSFSWLWGLPLGTLLLAALLRGLSSLPWPGRSVLRARQGLRFPNLPILWRREFRLQAGPGGRVWLTGLLIGWGLSAAALYFRASETQTLAALLFGLLPGLGFLWNFAHLEGAGWARLRSSPLPWRSYLERKLAVFLTLRLLIILPAAIGLAWQDPGQGSLYLLAPPAILAAGAVLGLIWGAGRFSMGAVSRTQSIEIPLIVLIVCLGLYLPSGLGPWPWLACLTISIPALLVLPKYLGSARGLGTAIFFSGTR